VASDDVVGKIRRLILHPTVAVGAAGHVAVGRIVAALLAAVVRSDWLLWRLQIAFGLLLCFWPRSRGCDRPKAPLLFGRACSSKLSSLFLRHVAIWEGMRRLGIRVIARHMRDLTDGLVRVRSFRHHHIAKPSDRLSGFRRWSVVIC
jgi:hypothetical protein